jgi:hypothetical protein
MIPLRPGFSVDEVVIAEPFIDQLLEIRRGVGPLGLIQIGIGRISMTVPFILNCGFIAPPAPSPKSAGLAFL